MKTITTLSFNELTTTEQEKLITEQIEVVISLIMDGHTDICGEESETIILDCIEEMDRLQTPWFLGQALYDKLSEEFRLNALANLEDLQFTRENIQAI